MLKSIPSLILTSTITLPSVPAYAGAMHAASVDVTRRAPAPVTVVAPNLHASPSLLRLAPCTLTTAPPVTDPRLGQIASTVGASKYPYVAAPSSSAPSCLKATVTWACVLPGAVHTTVESLPRLPDTASAPNTHSVRAALLSRLLPVTVTTVPPRLGPLLGLIQLTLPPLSYVNPARPVPGSAPLLLTITPTVPTPRDGATHVSNVDVMKRPRTVLFTPNKQLSPPVCAKCWPTTVTT